MKLKGLILKAIDSPKELEILYRGNPDEFVEVFPEVYKKHPDSLVMQAWQVRLTISEPVKGKAQAQHVVEETNPGRFRLLKSILIVFLLTIVAGTLIKLPHFFPKIDGDLFYIRNLAPIIILSLAVYFITQKLPPLKVLIVFVLLSAGTVVYMIFLPDLNYSDSITLSYIHMPFFFWSLLGLAFLGANWRNMVCRLDYIRYNGELLIYSTILYISSAIFIAITFALFSLIDNPDILVGEFLSEYALVYGMVALPLVATLLIDKILGNRINIASVLSKVFAPLFLIMVTVYLVVIVVNQENPFMDRDFLLTFNFLLILVLALSIFSILERPAKETAVTSDYI